MPLDREARSAGSPAAQGDEIPAFVRESSDEWVRLDSGEWLRGKATALVRGTLEFDSDELGDLNLDWDDVEALYTKRPFTLLFEDKTTATGPLVVEGDEARVTTPAGELGYRRRDVQRIVSGSLRERDSWSGKLRLGYTARTGNTDQTDLVFGASAKRRTAATRLELALDSVRSDQDGTEVADNQRLAGHFDYYVTSRLYLTPLGVEAYRDRFQNLDMRLAAYAGGGYTLVERSSLEWDGQLALGYRSTRFDEVATGQDRTQDTTVAVAGTSLDSDLNAKLELSANYQAQIGLEDLQDTDQSAWIELSYDVWGDLDLDVRISWNRIGDPEPDASGDRPGRDDVRIDVGLGWSF